MNNIDPSDKVSALAFAIKLAGRECINGSNDPLAAYHLGNLRAMHENAVRQARAPTQQAGAASAFSDDA